MCRQAAPRHSCVVLDEHSYTDQELSGAISERPGYLALLDAAKARQFDTILLESQDRLWRDQGEMHHALKRLRFYGVSVIEVTTGADLTGRTGGILATVQGLNAELFLDNLRDKTRRGMQEQILRGFAVGGRAYGYRARRSSRLGRSLARAA